MFFLRLQRVSFISFALHFADAVCFFVAANFFLVKRKCWIEFYFVTLYSGLVGPLKVKPENFSAYNGILRNRQPGFVVYRIINLLHLKMNTELGGRQIKTMNAPPIFYD